MDHQLEPMCESYYEIRHLFETFDGIDIILMKLRECRYSAFSKVIEYIDLNKFFVLLSIYNNNDIETPFHCIVTP